MEKIIAKEISPNGIDREIISFFEENENDLMLNNSVFYYGFPVFRDYEASTVRSKFCILSKKHGIILINTSNKYDLNNDDEKLSQLYSFVESSIKKSKNLRISKNKLALNLNSYLYIENPEDSGVDSLDSEVFSSFQDIRNALAEINTEAELDNKVFDEARSIIEGSIALTKASKRTKISNDPGTKLNVLIELEKEISSFDVEQRKIAISLINGPQRIRGLAGSGKTVVLAMKAAHIHLQHPTKKILFTFYTKSLYGLIKESISRFYRHFAGEEPSWDLIDVLHSWGGKSIDGVYYNACLENSVVSIPLTEAKQSNNNDPFSFVCKDIESKNIKSKYDYILIDEAQDLPNEFFQLCYKLAIGESGINKNIVWAYDDLQSIFNVYQRTPEILFGTNENGNPKIDLNAFKLKLDFDQSNDLVLYKCYRNPLDVLVTAHALGFAIYSERPVQMLQNKDHWTDIGYSIENDQDLIIGTTVTIKRNRENSPLSIYEYQTVRDIIQCYKATSMENECLWISDNIKAAIDEGIKPHDILIVCLDDRYAKGYFAKISLFLMRNAIRSNNLLASSSSAPPFSLDDMVTLSTVHRAKGNEAAIVFAAGIDGIFSHRASRKGRNRLFTAFTRTKAWLRVSGVGEKAQFFFNEIDQSIQNSPSLVFKVPDANEIETIQRDLNSKPQEIIRINEMYNTLIKKGYTKEQIDAELDIPDGDLLSE